MIAEKNPLRYHTYAEIEILNPVIQTKQSLLKLPKDKAASQRAVAAQRKWLKEHWPDFDKQDPRPGFYQIFRCEDTGQMFVTREDTQVAIVHSSIFCTAASPCLVLLTALNAAASFFFLAVTCAALVAAALVLPLKGLLIGKCLIGLDLLMDHRHHLPTEIQRDLLLGTGFYGQNRA